MVKVAVLLTVFNRKETTLRCLRSFFLLLGEMKEYTFDVFMTNDGCTDGTPEAVKNEFPSVYIINGDGNLYWSGGMRKAWVAASKNDVYDYYLWLNDDVRLFAHSIKEIFEISKVLNDRGLICGAFVNEQGGFTYGGYSKDLKPVQPNGTIQDVVYTNGNLLLIPQVIYNCLGYIPKYFIHDGGDNDYGLRAIENGFHVVTTYTYIGICPENPKKKYGKTRKMGTTIFKRLQYLYSPHGFNPNIAFRYYWTHFGLKKAIYVYLGLHYNAILPDCIFIRKNQNRINSYGSK